MRTRSFNAAAAAAAAEVKSSSSSSALKNARVRDGSFVGELRQTRKQTKRRFVSVYSLARPRARQEIEPTFKSGFLSAKNKLEFECDLFD